MAYIERSIIWGAQKQKNQPLIFFWKIIAQIIIGQSFLMETSWANAKVALLIRRRKACYDHNINQEPNAGGDS